MPLGQKVPERMDLLDALHRGVREQSRATLLLHQAIADRLGLNATDHKCLDLIMQTGGLTPGQLVESTGLTSGAVTGVLDRLERAGFVRRQHDSEDRRRILVCPVADKSETALQPLIESLQRSFAEMCAAYSDEQLAFLVDFVRRTSQLLHEETAKLRMASG